MASNFSFDIVSEVDLQEVDNAVNQAKKELAQRYDFKNSRSSIEYDRTEKKITLVAPDVFDAELTEGVGEINPRFFVKMRNFEYSDVRNGAFAKRHTDIGNSRRPAGGIVRPGMF